MFGENACLCIWLLKGLNEHYQHEAEIGEIVAAFAEGLRFKSFTSGEY